MIESLSSSRREVFKKQTLRGGYVEIHVGGDDPAEPCHVAMTARMIERVVRPDEDGSFFDCFAETYNLSFQCCAAIKQRDHR